jgi:hypothetical protein
MDCLAVQELGCLVTTYYRISIDLCINRGFPVFIDFALPTQKVRDLARDLSTGGPPGLRGESSATADISKREVTEHVCIA